MGEENKGSLTIEALLVLPIVIFIFIVFLKVGQLIFIDFQSNYQLKNQNLSESDCLPADLIRRTDLILDWGRGLKELLPSWY